MLLDQLMESSGQLFELYEDKDGFCLKCGGTLEERAQRLFSTKKEAAPDPNLLAKKNQRKPGRGKNVEKQKEVARLEAHVYKLADSISHQRVSTKRKCTQEGRGSIKLQ